jgi:hypothetical protein
MNSSRLSITRMARIMDQILAGACTKIRFLSKSTQKLYSRKPLQQNQQLGARALHSLSYRNCADSHRICTAVTKTHAISQ